MGVTQSNSGLFSTPGFLVSPSDLSVSSIFGLRSSYMLEYCWLFTLLLRSARYFTGIEGKWTPLPPISPPSCDFHEPLDFHRPIAALAQWSLCGIHYWLSEDYNEVWKNCTTHYSTAPRAPEAALSQLKRSVPHACLEGSTPGATEEESEGHQQCLGEGGRRRRRRRRRRRSWGGGGLCAPRSREFQPPPGCFAAAAATI